MYKKKVKLVWKGIFVALAVLFAVSVIVFSETGFFSVTTQNISLCNVQGQVFGLSNENVSSGVEVNCTLSRTSGLTTNYTVFTGEGFPDTDTYNNYYRCAMVCGNVQQDNITVQGFNSTDLGNANTSLSSSTLFLNITFSDAINPTIVNITGNTTGTTGELVEIEINGSDNSNISGANITLGNDSIFQMSYIIEGIYRVNLTMNGNSTATVNYTVALYDLQDNIANSSVYIINVSDNDNPVANASNDMTASQNTNLHFNATDSYDNVAVTTYYWDFGDGTAINNEEAPLHNYTLSGLFTVSLTVSDAAGNNGTDTSIATIIDAVAPYVVSNNPENGTQNVSLNTDIRVNFSEFIRLSTLTTTTVDVTDSSGSKVYGNVSFVTATNTTIFDPYVLLKENTLYYINLTTSIQDNSTNTMEQNYLFNFSTKKRDTDNDGIPDDEETDDDNDGVDDNVDKVKGNATTIKSSFSGATITFNGSANFTNVSNKTNEYRVNISNGTTTVVNFTVDLSTTPIDLTNVSIFRSNNNTVSEIIISGLNMSSGQKKTIYIENKSYKGVCVKDIYIENIGDITQSCNGVSEYKVFCDGSTLNDTYRCSYDTTTGLFEISGLSYSGIREIDYDPTVVSGDDDSGSGSPGGGGGGGAATCTEAWYCGDWSVCQSSGKKARSCTDINSCGTSNLKPSTELFCVYIPPYDGTSSEDETDEVTIEQQILTDDSADSGKVGETTQEEKDLAGQAFKKTSKYKENVYFLLFVGLIVLALVVFNVFRGKHKQHNDNH